MDDLPEDEIRVSKKTGKRYLPLFFLPTESIFGDDYMILTDVPKGQDGTFLGNARFVKRKRKNNNSKNQDNA